MRIKYDNTRNNSNIVNSMKINITRHALERFLSRDPSPTPIKDPEKTIEKLFKKAIPITFTKEYQIKRMLSNGFEDINYFYNNGWIFVCSTRDPKDIITMERQGDKRFNKDIFSI